MGRITLIAAIGLTLAPASLGKVVGHVPTGYGPDGMAVGAGAVWVNVARIRLA